MRKNNLSSERISELEKTRRIIAVKKQQLSRLMVELAELKQTEKELTPITQELERLQKGDGSAKANTANDELTPAELPFQATRIYTPA